MQGLPTPRRVVSVASGALLLVALPQLYHAKNDRLATQTD